MNEDKVLLELRDLIARFMRTRREELDITQQKLAEMSGIGIATIKRLEAGKSWPNLKQYLLLCLHLGCCPKVSDTESSDQFTKATGQVTL